MTHQATITDARANFLAALCKMKVLTQDKHGIPNIADSGSKASTLIAQLLCASIGSVPTIKKGSGQHAGKLFEKAVCLFLKETFLRLGHLRPGTWEIVDGTTSKDIEISNFEQYDHLAKLTQVIASDKSLLAALGADYLITPDVVVLRYPVEETALNQPALMVDEMTARLTPLRGINRPKGTRILHASVSCKWTLRSDRAQNARSEALNLIRNRKGRVPHICAVTAEPLPTRIGSLARGTSDLDCVYHIALTELRQAVAELAKDGMYQEQLEELEVLVNGKRLRDLADLPLDLTV